MWVVGCEKPNPKMNSCMEIITNLFDLSRVLLEFHPNLKFLKLGLVKPHMEQDEYRILSLRLDSWFNGK